MRTRKSEPSSYIINLYIKPRNFKSKNVTWLYPTLICRSLDDHVQHKTRHPRLRAEHDTSGPQPAKHRLLVAKRKTWWGWVSVIVVSVKVHKKPHISWFFVCPMITQQGHIIAKNYVNIFPIKSLPWSNFVHKWWWHLPRCQSPCSPAHIVQNYFLTIRMIWSNSPDYRSHQTVVL